MCSDFAGIEIVIPLLLPGVEPSALALWFDEEPVGVKIELKVGGVSEALPQILAALGERLPDDYQPQQTILQKPVEELIVKLSDPKVETIDSKRRASATATLVYEPADGTARNVESRRFSFTTPLGPIEADDLRWYTVPRYRRAEFHDVLKSPGITVTSLKNSPGTPKHARKPRFRSNAPRPTHHPSRSALRIARCKCTFGGPFGGVVKRAKNACSLSPPT